MTTRVPIILFVIVLLLLGVLAYQMGAPAAPIVEPAIAARPAAPGLAKLASFVPRPQTEYAIISTRSAFDPARRPVTEPSQAAATNTGAPPPLTLVGVIQGGTDAVALLLKDNGQSISLRTGQSVDGWQLMSIAPGRAVFRAGATDYTVTLRAAAGMAQPPLNNGSPPPSTEKPGP